MSWDWSSSRGIETSSSGAPAEICRVPRLSVLTGLVLLALTACEVGSAPTDGSIPTVESTTSSAHATVPQTTTPSHPTSTLSFDEQRTILLDAYQAMGVKPCCPDDSIIGSVVELGFEYDGGHVFVIAGPAQFLATADRLAKVPVQVGPVRRSEDGWLALFECGPSWYSLAYLVDGFGEEIPIEAIERFRAALGCA